MKVVDRFFRISWNIVKDVSCVCYVCSRMRCCHGNKYLLLMLSTKLLMTLVITKTRTRAIQCFKCHYLTPNFIWEKNSPELLQCEGCCWIGLKPRFSPGLCLGTLRMQICMRTLLSFRNGMLLQLISGSHVWISLSIVVTCSLTSFAGSMCSWLESCTYLVRIAE